MINITTDKHITKYKYIKVTHYTSQIYRYKVHTQKQKNSINKTNQEEFCKLTSSQWWYNFSASPIKYSPGSLAIYWSWCFTNHINSDNVYYFTDIYLSSQYTQFRCHTWGLPSYSSPFVHPLTISGLQSSAFGASFPSYHISFLGYFTCSPGFNHHQSCQDLTHCLQPRHPAKLLTCMATRCLVYPIQLSVLRLLLSRTH